MTMTHWQLFVLIDTWWNVNEYGIDVSICDDIVLIDTWWNVNTVRVINSDIMSKF